MRTSVVRSRGLDRGGFVARGAGVHLAVSYYVDDSYYSNVGKGSSRHSQRVYWRNIAVMFATARRMFPSGAQLTAFTNAVPPSEVGRVLVDLDVRRMDIGFSQPYPPDFYPRFRGAFHLLDVLAWYAAQNGGDAPMLVVDPDCLWVRPPHRVLETLLSDGYLACSVDYDVERRANGVSRADMGRIFPEVATGPGRSVPFYIGGEFVGATAPFAVTLAEALEAATQANVARWRRGEATLNTEEHILSYAFWSLGLRPNHAGLMRRIFTGAMYRNVEQDDHALTLWHLPSEKKRGLYRLFTEVQRPGSPFWKLEGDDLRRYLARHTGVVPTPARRLQEAVRRPAVHLKRRAGLNHHRPGGFIAPGT